MWSKSKQIALCLLAASPAATLSAIHGLQVDPRSLCDVAMSVFCLITSALGGYLLGKSRPESV